jgi:hypothetical protein
MQGPPAPWRSRLCIRSLLNRPARRLAISAHTAKFHVRSGVDKLDAIGRTDAVAQAARFGIVHL